MTVYRTQQAHSRKANRYEKRWTGYLSHTHEQFLQRLETNPRDIILDVSCGTGMLAEKLIKGSFPFRKLVLNDISYAMQRQAEKRISGNDQILFTRYPAHDMAFPETMFSDIFCLNSFHNYLHQTEVVDQFNRILKPDGVLYLLDWNRSGFFRIINLLISLSTDDYLDTRSSDELRIMLEDSGFSVIRTESWYYNYWNLFFVKARKRERLR